MITKLKSHQKQILLLLYKFRFLNINQLLKYFNHKYPSRIREWLTNLKEKEYISVIVDKKDPTKLHAFCLATKAKDILQENIDYDKKFLDRLYKEKRLKENFRNHCLFIVDIYLYFLSQQDKDSTLHFLTKQDLIGYDFFPEELPDAYIAVETKDGTDKYFLDLFDEYRKPAGVARFNVRKYITYCEEGSWQANAKNSPFPTLLFIVADDRRRKHIHMYGKAKLQKTFEDISLFLTTQDNIRFSKGKINIWKKVE
jgi:hypothetical protein